MDQDTIKKLLLKAGCPEKLTDMPAIVERLVRLAEQMSVSEIQLKHAIKVEDGEVTVDLGKYAARFQETEQGAKYRFSDDQSYKTIKAVIDQCGMDMATRFSIFGFDSSYYSMEFTRTDKASIQERYNGFVFSDREKVDDGDPILIDSSIVFAHDSKPIPYGYGTWERNKEVLTEKYPMVKGFFDGKEKQTLAARDQQAQVEALKGELAEKDERIKALEAENEQLRQKLMKMVLAYEEKVQEQGNPEVAKTNPEEEERQ